MMPGLYSCIHERARKELHGGQRRAKKFTRVDVLNTKKNIGQENRVPKAKNVTRKKRQLSPGMKHKTKLWFRLRLVVSVGFASILLCQNLGRLTFYSTTTIRTGYTALNWHRHDKLLSALYPNRVCGLEQVEASCKV